MRRSCSGRRAKTRMSDPSDAPFFVLRAKSSSFVYSSEQRGHGPNQQQVLVQRRGCGHIFFFGVRFTTTEVGRAPTDRGGNALSHTTVFDTVMMWDSMLESASIP
ncbi:uncharacterized protein Tco025E_08573, partial [Trypanosoma conorhini]